MMKSLKGTATLENLMKSFAGESQARNRYTFFASIAKKEGFRQIEEIFLETANHERAHAKRFYDLMLEGLDGELPTGVEIHAMYPVAKGTTLDNLKYSADGENEEWTALYPEFAKIAEAEGFANVAAAYKMILKVEERHEIRYNKLYENVKAGRVFQREEKTSWICLNCGHVHESHSAPDVCPTCLHPKDHFELFVEAY
jgi:rubrerythrin